MLCESVGRIGDDVAVPLLIVQEQEVTHLAVASIYKVSAYDIVAVSDELLADMTLAAGWLQYRAFELLNLAKEVGSQWLRNLKPSRVRQVLRLSASANGGTPDYTYAWNSGESNVSITVSPIATTTYTVTVTDANNCTVVASKNIVVNTELTVSISGDTEVQCFGDITASLTATANGGSMAMGYTYAWSNSQSGQIISTLGAGNYSVTVTDGNSCTASASTTITGPSAALSIDISATNNTLTCSNLSATITATVTGGTEGYTYNWSNSGTNNTSEVTTPGSYTVTVTDANGCSVEAAQTITEDKTAPTVTIDNNETELNCNRTSITLTLRQLAVTLRMFGQMAEPMLQLQ